MTHAVQDTRAPERGPKKARQRISEGAGACSTNQCKAIQDPQPPTRVSTPLEKSFLLIPAELWASLWATRTGSQEKTIWGISEGRDSGEWPWNPQDTPPVWVGGHEPYTL